MRYGRRVDEDRGTVRTGVFDSGHQDDLATALGLACLDDGFARVETAPSPW